MGRTCGRSPTGIPGHVTCEDRDIWLKHVCLLLRKRLISTMINRSKLTERMRGMTGGIIRSFWKPCGWDTVGDGLSALSMNTWNLGEAVQQ